MSYRAELGLAACLAVALVIAAVVGGRQRVAQPSDDPRTSTYLDGPLGTKAVYDVLIALGRPVARRRSEEHTSELQSRLHLVCRLLLEKKKKTRSLGSEAKKYIDTSLPE